ncbi:MAG: hypothetical protein GVY14_10025 [Spirochaetes bacterium]|nr:hypothetical protein [Spirochaetota bacterium]
MQHFRLSRLFTVLLLIMSLATVVSGQQAEDAQADPENGEQSYTGTWSLVIGPSRLLWEIEADSYEFYAYQAGTVRIGSRGEISVEDDVITFLARETTEDGEEWREVELPEEDASASFAYSVEERRLAADAEEGEAAEAGSNADAEEGDVADGDGDDAEAAAVGDADAQLLLRLSIPGRPQFYTDYRAGSGEERVEEEAAGDGPTGDEGAAET